MNKFKKLSLLMMLFLSSRIFTLNTFASNADVDAPTLAEVRNVVSGGLDMIFGMLGGYAVIIGGMSIYNAVTSYRDSVDKGGYGKSRSDFIHHLIAGILQYL